MIIRSKWCGVLSHHSNNKTNFLPTFQSHNLLTGTLLLSTYLFTKELQKLQKKTLKCVFIKNKNDVFYI